jgi:hypothetical protein
MTTGEVAVEQIPHDKTLVQTVRVLTRIANVVPFHRSVTEYIGIDRETFGFLPKKRRTSREVASIVVFNGGTSRSCGRTIL